MPNFPMEPFFNDTPIQQLSTALCRQRESSSSTISLVDGDNNRSIVSGSEKSTTMLTQEYQEEGKEALPIEDLIRQLLSELQQTKALVAELETRLELTEQTSQEIVGELKNLLSENESESHTTVVEIDQGSDDMNIDNEFYISSSLMNQEEISGIDNEQEAIACSKLLLQDETTIKSATPFGSSITQHTDDSNDSFNRICSALQNLINDGQVALQKPNLSSSHHLLGLPQTKTRPRAHSWSSNVSSWIMSHYNPSPVVVCECGSCWLCLESGSNSLSSSTTTRTTPKSSRANSISSVQNPFFSLKSHQQEPDKGQINLAGIKKQYRKKLERRFDYRKSCDDLETELQKLITTAISTGVEHGLMHSPVYRQHQYTEDFSSTSDYNYFGNYFDEEMSDESYDENYEENFSRFPTNFPKSFEIFCKREQFKELEDDFINGNNNNNNDINDNEKKSSKWRGRIWGCLQKIGIVNFSSNNENVSEEEDDYDNENCGYSSYSSYNSSWNSSSRDYRENSNEDSSNPFPSSFINTLNVGQNIFNFNVNLKNSTTNNYNNKTINNHFNEVDNSIHTTNNYKTSADNNNHEEKLSPLNSTKEDFTFRRSASKKLQSLSSKYMNFLAMMGLIISMSQTFVSNPMASNIIRSSAKRRRSGKDMILMVKVIKYVAVLFVGWAAGRIGKKQKGSSDENNRITEIP